MSVRYQIVELKRRTKGFSAVIVDNKHPSGVSGVPIQWFVSVEEAETKCRRAGASYEISRKVA